MQQIEAEVPALGGLVLAGDLAPCRCLLVRSRDVCAPWPGPRAAERAGETCALWPGPRASERAGEMSVRRDLGPVPLRGRARRVRTVTWAPCC